MRIKDPLKVTFNFNQIPSGTVYRTKGGKVMMKVRMPEGQITYTLDLVTGNLALFSLDPHLFDIGEVFPDPLLLLRGKE